MKMRCEKCGYEVIEDAKYCPRCGTEFEKDNTEPDFNDAENELLAAYAGMMKGGSEDAKAEGFSGIYEATYKKVFGRVVTKVPERAIDDTVQNVYQAVWEKIDQLQDPKAFKGWFWTIVKNKCNDAGRGAKKEQDNKFTAVISDDEGNELDIFDTLADDELPLPEDGIATEEMKQMIREALDSLPVDQRYALDEFFYGNKSIKAIAEEMGASENTVKSWMKRGKAAMNKRLSPYANANGLKLVPLSIIPLMSILAKEDAKACELASANHAEVYASLERSLGIVKAAGAGTAAAGTTTVGPASAQETAKKAVSDAAKKGAEEARKAAGNAKKAAQDFLESEEWANTKQAAKDAAKDGADAAKKAAKEAGKVFNEKVAPEAGKVLGEAAKSGLLVKVAAGVVAAGVAIGCISAVVNKGGSEAQTEEAANNSEYNSEDAGNEIPESDLRNDEEDSEDTVIENLPADYVADDGTVYHYASSLEDIPESVLEDIANNHSACVIKQCWEDSESGVYQYVWEPEYIGSYLIVSEYDKKTTDNSATGIKDNILVTVYKTQVQSKTMAEPYTLYRVDANNSLYYSDDGKWILDGGDGITTNWEIPRFSFITDDYVSFHDENGKLDHTEKLEDGATGIVVSDTADNDYLKGKIKYQYKLGTYRNTRILHGYENPIELEEVVAEYAESLTDEYDHYNITLEADFDVNNLEAYEYHVGSYSHVLSKDMLTFESRDEYYQKPEYKEVQLTPEEEAAADGQGDGG